MGTVNTLSDASFTFNNTETNTKETHNYSDVTSVEKGKEYIGSRRLLCDGKRAVDLYPGRLQLLGQRLHSFNAIEVAPTPSINSFSFIDIRKAACIEVWRSAHLPK